ncbi:MAG: hypothetical protein U0324_37275 [Polyangiales bacterium]
MRPSLPSLAVALLLPCCGLQPAPDARVVSAPEAAAGRAVASPPDASVAGNVSVAADAAPPPVAPTATASADPCELRAPVDLRLRRTLYDRNPTTVVPAGTALELLAVKDWTRGTLERLGVLSRVRVRTTGAEGYVFLDAQAVRRCQDHRAPSPDVRESRTVIVDGVAEEWRVRFVTPPGENPPIPEDEWNCIVGFYNRFDRGDAVLERLRDGVVIDRFDNPCGPSGVNDSCAPRLLIPRHVTPYVPGRRTLPAATTDRHPWTTWLDLADYNHDGQATELAAYVGHLACGVEVSAVIGITRERPRLHVLRWADGAAMTLAVDATWWDAVRASPRGEQVTIGCGNHGYDGEQRVRWGPAARGLWWRVIEREMPPDCGWRRDGADVDAPDAGEGGEVDGGAPHPTGQPTL